MIHDRELAPPRPLSDEDDDARWPVPYAVMFITVASVALWSLIILAARWLIG